MFICLHTQRKDSLHILKYLIFSVTKTLLSFCTANSRTPSKCVSCQLLPPLLCLAGAALRLTGLAAQLHRNKSQIDTYLSPALLYIMYLP